MSPNLAAIKQMFGDTVAPNGRLVYENFAKWLGDSRVVDSEGKPLVVYHGTASDFNIFNNGRGAIYFAADHEAAHAYAKNVDGNSGPRVVEAYLRIENPRVINKEWADENLLDEDGIVDWTVVDEVAYEAEEEGHDGLILQGLPDFCGMDGEIRTERAYDQYVVFKPEQIKSARGNTGDFDAASPSLTDGPELSYDHESEADLPVLVASERMLA